MKLLLLVGNRVVELTAEQSRQVLDSFLPVRRVSMMWDQGLKRGRQILVFDQALVSAIQTYLGEPEAGRTSSGEV